MLKARISFPFSESAENQQRAPHHVLQKLASCAADACTDPSRQPIFSGAQHLRRDAAIWVYCSLTEYISSCTSCVCAEMPCPSLCAPRCSEPRCRVRCARHASQQVTARRCPASVFIGSAQLLGHMKQPCCTAVRHAFASSSHIGATKRAMLPFDLVVYVRLIKLLESYPGCP